MKEKINRLCERVQFLSAILLLAGRGLFQHAKQKEISALFADIRCDLRSAL